MIFELFLDFLDTIGVQYSKEDVERKILVISLCELDNPLLSSGCLTMIFGIQAVLDTKCVVKYKWV